MDTGLDIQFFHQIFPDITVIEGDPFPTAVFRKELAHHAFRKKPFIHIPLIVPEVPPQFGQQFRLRHCERNIRKAGLSFELGGNGKAQQDVKRDMAVIPALVRQGLCERSCEPPPFHCKEDVIYQVGE